MKKIFLTMFVCVLLLLLLVGCNNNTNEVKNEERKEFVVNLDKLYDAIIAEQPEEKKEELNLFKETNEELINSYYVGLSDIELSEKSIYMHPIGFASEIALVKVNDISDIEKVKNVFESRIQLGINSTMCDSESQDIWERRAEIQVKDKYVCLIVFPDGYNIPEDIFSLEAKNGNEEVIDFKSIYEEKLNTLQSGDLYSEEYALYDLDKDETPEMITKVGMSEADTKITIYDVIDGELKEIYVEGFGGHTNIVGASEINSIIFQYGQMGYEKVGVLNYNQDGTYQVEIVKEAEIDPEIGYIPFETLKMYSFEDKEGLNWSGNPIDENYWYINSGNAEV